MLAKTAAAASTGSSRSAREEQPLHPTFTSPVSLIGTSRSLHLQASCVLIQRGPLDDKNPAPPQISASRRRRSSAAGAFASCPGAGLSVTPNQHGGAVRGGRT